MANAQTIQIGQLQINYLHDGAESGKLGCFEVTVPSGAVGTTPDMCRVRFGFVTSTACA